MAAPDRCLRFAWWNAQDFAHFEPARASEARWPSAPEAYRSKCERVDRVLRDLFAAGQPEILALAETTRVAAEELRDRLLPGYEVFSGDVLPRAQLQISLLYAPGVGCNPDLLVAPDMPRGTRPMIQLDLPWPGHRLRVFACHWTARFDEESGSRRVDLARHLGNEIYEFVHGPGPEPHHVLVMGDLNEEPFDRLFRERLYATRHRAASRKREHYTDRDVRRVRMYNCSWRWLGERRAHDGSPFQGDTAGTYYWEEKGEWYTMDQILVNGTLLSDEPPFLDEANLEVIATPFLLGQDGHPSKFQRLSGKVWAIVHTLRRTGSGCAMTGWHTLSLRRVWLGLHRASTPFAVPAQGVP